VPSAADTFAQYRLDARVERRGPSVSDVFLATDERDGTPALLEILRAGLTGVEKARFGTRARRLSGVSDPSVLAVLDAATTHCALEAPFNQSLDEHAGIAIARARQKLFWLAQVARALVTLHRAGIVHGALSLDSVTVAPDGSVKVAVPIGGDVSGSPLDDVRAFATAACELLLGADAPREASSLAERIHDAGAPRDAAGIIAHIRAGGTMTSADLAEKLASFADYSGPSTEPLLPIVPRRD